MGKYKKSRGFLSEERIWRLWMNPSQWRHNERDCASNHRRLDCLLNRLFKRRSKTIPKLRATCFYEVKTPVTGEFPAQRASYAENVSIWWRHHATSTKLQQNTCTRNLCANFLWRSVLRLFTRLKYLSTIYYWEHEYKTFANYHNPCGAIKTTKHKMSFLISCRRLVCISKYQRKWFVSS